MKVAVAFLIFLAACAQNPRPATFEEYGVALAFHGQPAPVDLSSAAEARRFRTRLSEAASEGPNFADHFTIASWGCGTDCHILAVIDARTGKVTFVGGYDVGVTFRRDSRLLITDPPEALAERGWQFPRDCEQAGVPTTKYFDWNGEALNPVQSTAPCPTR